MEGKISGNVIVFLGAGTGGSLNRATTQFCVCVLGVGVGVWGGWGEGPDTFFGSVRLRIEETWPWSASLLQRATHLVQVLIPIL